MIMNLTQHLATPEQLAAGVEDLPEDARAELARALTFDAAMLAANPSAAQAHIAARAREIVSQFVLPRLMYQAGEILGMDGLEALNLLRPKVAANGLRAMIGGAPYLMAPLERALRDVGVTPVYALSDRVSEEQPQPDGSVRKIAVFRHLGFVEATEIRAI